MSRIVATRIYVDGDRRMRAEILDTGLVRFADEKAPRGSGTALSAIVLEQLVELAREAKKGT